MGSMPTPQPLTPARNGSDDSSKQVYDPMESYPRSLTRTCGSPKHVSNDAPEVLALPQYAEGLERHQQAYSGSQYQDHLTYAPAQSSLLKVSSTASVTGQPPSGKKRAWRRPSWLVAMAVAAVAALLAATVSGVAVWKASEAKSSSTACSGNGNGGAGGDDKGGGRPECPSISATTTARGSDKAIRPNSGITTVGWWIKSESYIQVVYQNPSGALMTSWFSSMWGNWTVPQTVFMEKDDHLPAAGTALAISTIWWAQDGITQHIAQNQMNYMSSNGTAMGYNFRLAWPQGLADSIMTKGFTGLVGSSVASLWPYNFYQASDAIMQVSLASAGVAKLPALPNAASLTPLLALPLAARRAREELRLFYRDTDGKLAMYERDASNTITDKTGPLGGVDLPADAALGGFATARPGAGLGINTYLLWQDPSQPDNGGIRILSQTNGDRDWKGPVSDPAFAGADVPTHIACITEGMGVSQWNGQGDAQLSNKRDLNRCFFQAEKGKLKQVWHDGTRWVGMGYVPMP